MLVFGSHDHDDHIDRQAWPAIAKAASGAKFVVPDLLREAIVRDLGLPEHRVLGMDEGISVREMGITITAVPAAHEDLDEDPATGRHPYLGYILCGNGFRLYHAGDTCPYEGMQAKLRREPLDLALLPINGRDARRLAAGCIGNMTYQEAGDLAAAIGPGLTIPTHFEMFADNSEAPQRFVDYLRVNYPHLKTCIPRHGVRLLAGKRGERLP
jgi:L-ascorbate metabolism protein UlaG (beta-lactamase superfamily)